MQTETVKLNKNITVGNATIVGTELGWALPGGDETRNYHYAYRIAERMAVLMQGYVGEGGV